jgi:hypothetical protein
LDHARVNRIPFARSDLTFGMDNSIATLLIESTVFNTPNHQL